MLLISFCFAWNAWNILYQIGNTIHSTSGQILANFGKFRPFLQILRNFMVSNFDFKKEKKRKYYKPINLRSPIMSLVIILLSLFSIFSSPSSSSLLHFSLFFFFFYSFNFLVFCFYCLRESSSLLSFNFYEATCYWLWLALEIKWQRKVLKKSCVKLGVV